MYKKYILFLLFLFLIINFSVFVFASSLILLSSQNDTDYSNLESIVESDRQENLKYKFIPKQLIEDVEYTVHEYETSKKEIGYSIIQTIQKENLIYQKITATGIQKIEREQDWTLIKTIIASTTKEI